MEGKIELKNQLDDLYHAIICGMYEADGLFQKCFTDIMGYEYNSYTIDDDETRNRWETIKDMRKNNCTEELIISAVNISDYTGTRKMFWVLNSYFDKCRYFRIAPKIARQILMDEISKRERYLASLNLDYFYKTTDESFYRHYFYQLRRLLSDDASYNLYAIDNANTLYIGRYTDSVCRVILNYIIENKIVPSHHDIKTDIEVRSPFIENTKINSSSNVVWMHHKIKLSSKDFKEIYKTIGSKKARKQGVYSFFSYMNSADDDNYFWLYFKVYTYTEI